MARWTTPLIVGGAAALILFAETKRPLRRRRESRLQRIGRNLTVAGLTAAVTSALQVPILLPVARRVEKRRLGLLHQLPVPRSLRILAGVLLLDYTLWWWHWLSHRVPYLWRFHLVHHVDRDLDASTAARFHFGELALSVFFRTAQTRLLGVDRLTMSIWNTMLMVSIFFHHSNLELSPEMDRLVSRFIVTPRMHGIHHSDYEAETNSNWSSLLSWWDFLHGTFREDVPQQSIEIGVPAYQHPQDVTLGKITVLPFMEQRDDWRDDAGNYRLDRFATDLLEF